MAAEPEAFALAFVVAEPSPEVVVWLLNLRLSEPSPEVVVLAAEPWVAEPSPEVVVLAAELFVVELEVSEPGVVFVAVVICC